MSQACERKLSVQSPNMVIDWRAQISEGQVCTLPYIILTKMAK